MTVPIARLAVVISMTAAFVSCAVGMNLAGQPLKKATIEVYRDGGNNCRTNTTPFFKIKRAEKATWTIKDETECLTGEAVVEILFNKGDGDPLVSSCVKKNKTKIECDVRADADYKGYDYSVNIPGFTEDPELEIAM